MIIISGDEVDNVLDRDIVVSDFKLQSSYYVRFWTYTLEKALEYTDCISAKE